MGGEVILTSLQNITFIILFSMLNFRNCRVLCKSQKDILKFSKNAFSSKGKDPKVAVETITVPSKFCCPYFVPSGFPHSTQFLSLILILVTFVCLQYHVAYLFHVLKGNF